MPHDLVMLAWAFSRTYGQQCRHGLAIFLGPGQVRLGLGNRLIHHALRFVLGDPAPLLQSFRLLLDPTNPILRLQLLGQPVYLFR